MRPAWGVCGIRSPVWVSAQATSCSLARASPRAWLSTTDSSLPAHPDLGIPISPQLLAFATRAKWAGKGSAQPAQGCWAVEGVMLIHLSPPLGTATLRLRSTETQELRQASRAGRVPTPTVVWATEFVPPQTCTQGPGLPGGPPGAGKEAGAPVGLVISEVEGGRGKEPLPCSAPLDPVEPRRGDDWVIKPPLSRAAPLPSVLLALTCASGSPLPRSLRTLPLRHTFPSPKPACPSQGWHAEKRGGAGRSANTSSGGGFLSG